MSFWPFSITPLCLQADEFMKGSNHCLVGMFPIFPKTNNFKGGPKFFQLLKLYLYQWLWYKILTCVMNLEKPLKLPNNQFPPIFHIPFIFPVDGEERGCLTLSITSSKHLNKPQASIGTITKDHKTTKVCCACNTSGDHALDLINQFPQYVLQNQKFCVDLCIKLTMLYTTNPANAVTQAAQQNCHPVPLLLGQVPFFDIFEAVHFTELLHCEERMGEHKIDWENSILSEILESTFTSQAALDRLEKHLWNLMPHYSTIVSFPHGLKGAVKLGGKEWRSIFKQKMFVNYGLFPEELGFVAENDVHWINWYSKLHQPYYFEEDKQLVGQLWLN